MKWINKVFTFLSFQSKFKIRYDCFLGKSYISLLFGHSGQKYSLSLKNSLSVCELMLFKPLYNFRIRTRHPENDTYFFYINAYLASFICICFRYNIRYGRVDAGDLEVEEAADSADIHQRILTFPNRKLRLTHIHKWQTCETGGSSGSSACQNKL